MTMEERAKAAAEEVCDKFALNGAENVLISIILRHMRGEGCG